jgi:hypothetical protein
MFSLFDNRICNRKNAVLGTVISCCLSILMPKQAMLYDDDEEEEEEEEWRHERLSH